MTPSLPQSGERTPSTGPERALERARESLPPRLPDDADVTAAFRRVLAATRDATEGSERLFATAGESFFTDGGLFSLPRFVHFGALGEPGALRLVLFAGWRGTELRPSLAQLAFLHRVLAEPAVAAGFNLLLYPIVNVTGFLDGTARTRLGHDLERAKWGPSPAAPELRSIAADFPRHAAHGWIALALSPVTDRIQVRVRRLAVHPDYLPIDLAGAAVDWLPGRAAGEVDPIAAGLAGLAPAAFGLSIDIPERWPLSRAIPATVQLLLAILTRYREAASFGGDL